jgi:integrase
MARPPTRNRLELGICERLDPVTGERLGLEIYWDDARGVSHRKPVPGGKGATMRAARDLLAKARTRRVGRELEPGDVRATFDAVADEFEALHVAGLRDNSQQAHHSALVRLRGHFGERKLVNIDRACVRAFITAERGEGLKANTINGHLRTLSALYSFAFDDLNLPVTMPRLKPSDKPKPAEDEREKRILNDDELGHLLAACPERSQLYFRTLAETGMRESECLGLASRGIGYDTIEIAKQLSRRRKGELKPLKWAGSRRTIEITRGLAAEVSLVAGSRLVFPHLNHSKVEWDWCVALRRANLQDPQPTIHDLRHTHVSALIADNWDPQAAADRIGDTLKTMQEEYAHPFDAKRRGPARRAALEARYGAGDGRGMAGNPAQQSATDGPGHRAEIGDLQAKRNRAQ